MRLFHPASASAGLLILAACASRDPLMDRAALLRDHERLRARAAAEFKQGLYFKPRSGAMSGREMEFAPLIVQQAFEEEPARAAPRSFGAVVGEAEREVSIATDAPTLYASRHMIQLNGVDHEQITYVWWYPAGDDRPGDAPASPRPRPGFKRGVPTERLPFLRGVRLTLGLDGFPIVWEVLDGGWMTRRMFVSKSLELASAQVYGPPLQGRSYAVERSMEDAPHGLVVRAVEDGPVPMGPYVYLEGDESDVTSVLCRCSPAQCARFLKESAYDLQPREALPTRLESMIEKPRDLARDLRWPAGL